MRRIRSSTRASSPHTTLNSVGIVLVFIIAAVGLGFSITALTRAPLDTRSDLATLEANVDTLTTLVETQNTTIISLEAAAADNLAEDEAMAISITRLALLLNTTFENVTTLYESLSLDSTQTMPFGAHCGNAGLLTFVRIGTIVVVSSAEYFCDTCSITAAIGDGAAIPTDWQPIDTNTAEPITVFDFDFAGIERIRTGLLSIEGGEMNIFSTTAMGGNTKTFSSANCGGWKEFAVAYASAIPT